MDKSSRHIPVQERTAHERRKRQREITLAFVGIFLIVILTWIELRLLGLNSYLFFALFNVNLILLILVLFWSCAMSSSLFWTGEGGSWGRA